MSHLRRIAKEYLAVRRALGHRLVAFDAQLELFISFLESKGASFITVPLALEWAQQQQPANVTMKTRTKAC